MKFSFKIASVWGIPIELHLTFILLMVAFAVLSYPSYVTFLLILFLFFFVLVHELAHTFVAKHYNIKVRKIVLYPIGGVSEIEEIPRIPSIEWRVAIAGPLTSFLIGGLLLAANFAVQTAAPVTPISEPLNTAGSFMFDLAVLNLLLGGFNLIPAFPMDGGRIFRALLATRMKFTDATKYASYIGRLLGIGMVIFGILFPPYFLIIVVGLFVYVGATEEAKQTIISTNLARVRVSEVTCAEIGTVTPKTSLAEALETIFRFRYHDAIVEEDGKYLGLVVWSDLTKVKPEQRSQMRIEQLPLVKVWVYPDESVLEAQKIMIQKRLSAVPVVNRSDPTKVICVLTTEGIAASLDRAKSLR
jgi:Zn-dependent protease